MIKGYVQGQTLKLAQTRVVADTIDYLIAKFTFQGEVEGNYLVNGVTVISCDVFHA